MRNEIILVTATPLVVLCACTTSLKTERIGDAEKPLPGVLYNLPMATFDVEAKFLIVDCTINANNFAEVRYQLTEGAVKHNLAPDITETYRLDYQLLSSALKTTTASVVLHPNGMIKTVNADVDDRTSQTLMSLAGTAVNLFKASTLTFVPVAASDKKKCDKFLMDKIEKRRKLLEESIPAAMSADKELSDDKQAADDISSELEAAKKKLADAQAAKDNVAIVSANRDVTSAQAKLAVATAKLKDRKLQLPKLQAQLASLTSSLTATAKKPNWAPRKNQMTEVCETFGMDQTSFLERLATASNAKLGFQPVPSTMFSADVCVEVLLDPRVALAASADSKSQKEDLPASSALKKVEAFDGVVYRLPSSGTVYLRESKDRRQRIYAPSTFSMPQFGVKGLVWLKNEAFDKNTVKATFNEDGSMAELTFTAQSRAERAAVTAVDLSKSVVDLMQLRSDAIKAKAAAADVEGKKAQQKQIDTLDNQIALLEKQRALETARSPVRDSYDKEKERLQKEIDVERLRQELEDLKKKKGES